MGRTQHRHGPRGAVPRPVSPHHDDGGSTIVEQAAIAHCQGIGYHPRRKHVIDRQRVARRSLGVQLRPPARRHRDLGQLFARRAVKVHVPARRQRVGGDRRQRAIGRFPCALARHPDARGRVAGRIGAVGDQRAVDQPGIERQSSLLHVDLEGGTAGAVAVGNPRSDPQVFGQFQPAQRLVWRRSIERVDLGQGDARIGQREQGRPGRHVDRRNSRALADAESGCSDDGSLAAGETGISGHTGTKTRIGWPPSSVIRALTAIPIVTSSAAIPSTRLIRRGPSCRSTRTTL